MRKTSRNPAKKNKTKSTKQPVRNAANSKCETQVIEMVVNNIRQCPTDHLEKPPPTKPAERERERKKERKKRESRWMTNCAERKRNKGNNVITREVEGGGVMSKATSATSCIYTELMSRRERVGHHRPTKPTPNCWDSIRDFIFSFLFSVRVCVCPHCCCSNRAIHLSGVECRECGDEMQRWR